MSKVLERAECWKYGGKKFYDDGDYFNRLCKGFEFSHIKRDISKKYVRLELKQGDIVKDMWGRLGVVAKRYRKPVAEAEYSEYCIIVKHRDKPHLKDKYYWKPMLARCEIWRKKKDLENFHDRPI